MSWAQTPEGSADAGRRTGLLELGRTRERRENNKVNCPGHSAFKACPLPCTKRLYRTFQSSNRELTQEDSRNRIKLHIATPHLAFHPPAPAKLPGIIHQPQVLNYSIILTALETHAQLETLLKREKSCYLGY